MTDKKTKELYVWICPKCKKIIKSLYEGQFNTNKKAHEEMHKQKGDDSK